MLRKPEFIMPTNEEDALINQGISQDADSPELTAEDFLNAKPASVSMPELAAQSARATKNAHKNTGLNATESRSVIVRCL